MASPITQTLKNRLSSVVPVLWLGLLAFAVWQLHREWGGFHLDELDDSLALIGIGPISMALALTAASLLCNASLDLIALRWLGHTLPVRRVLATSLVAGSFSMNAGGTVLGGGTVRLRFYGDSGINGGDVAKISGFLLGAGWLGHALLVGGLLLWDPPETAWFPASAGHGLGAGLLLSCLVFILLPFARKSWRWAGYMPAPRFIVAAMVVSCADWLLAGLALRVLLPTSVPTTGFLAATALGQAVGAASHVPGGAGVMELAISKLAKGVVPMPVMAGALMTYRIVYYLIPFAVAIASVTLRELWRNRRWAKSTAKGTARVWAAMAPRVAGLTSLVGGFILMLSANSPMEPMRRDWLAGVVPLPFVEASHFLSSIAGTVMVIVSWGLLRRVQAAWWIAVTMAGCGAVFSLLKGFDYEEAVVLSLFMVSLLPFRHRFHRHARLWTKRFSLQWWGLLAAVVGLSLWFGFYTSRHVGYENDLWWQYSFENDAGRFLRAMAGSGLILLMVALAQWLRPAPPREKPSSPDMNKVARLVAAAPRTSAALALLGDKEFLFNEDGDAFLMFGEQGRTRVALGDPVGNEEAAEELLWRFVEQAQDDGMRPAFYQLSAAMIPVCVEMGQRVYKLGEQALVDLPSFGLAGQEMKKLRKVMNRMEREGWEFIMLQAHEVAAHIDALKSVSDQWLATHKAREKGFSLGRFDEAYLQRFPLAMLRVDGRIAAFANIWPGNGTDEISLDIMRHTNDAPNGTMDCLFVQVMLWGKEQGYQSFDLGMAPLSGLVARQFAPLWNRVGGLVFDHGEAFYNFNGLRAWKEKFQPTWHPRYLAVANLLDLAPALLDITSLIGSKPN